VTRRRYRYRSRAEAEDALAEVERRETYLKQALAAALDGDLAWFGPEEGGDCEYRLGAFRLTGSAGGLVVLEERTSTGANRDVLPLDDLRRRAAEVTRHGSEWGHAVGRLAERVRLARESAHDEEQTMAWFNASEEGTG